MTRAKSKLPDAAAKRVRHNSSLLGELWNFLKVRKAWWLTPIIIVLILIGMLIIFSQSSAVSPFIYALF